MVAGTMLRLFFGVVGVYVFVWTTLSLAKRSMMEPFCIAWGLVAVLFIGLGIVLRPTAWGRYIGANTLIIICLGVVFIVAVGLFFSVRISKLMREADEMAIQISLLNQENMETAKELSSLKEIIAEMSGMQRTEVVLEAAATAEEAYEKEDTVRH